MIRAVIIEDEKLIADEFRSMLEKASSEMEVLGSFSTVRESIDYLTAHEEPDIIFSDVQLTDGLSFDIFNRVNIKSPVVFITGYDQFILNAFEHNGIDYLLKPVDEKDLCRTLAKYKTLENHFAGHAFLRSFHQKEKTRLLVKKGIEYVPLKLQDVVLIYTENKLVYVLDRDGKKYMIDKHLADLEHELDPTVFFRVNRQYIVNIGYIKCYRTWEKVKLRVELTMAGPDHPIIISQETAPCFRKWISQL